MPGSLHHQIYFRAACNGRIHAKGTINAGFFDGISGANFYNSLSFAFKIESIPAFLCVTIRKHDPLGCQCVSGTEILCHFKSLKLVHSSHFRRRLTHISFLSSYGSLTCHIGNAELILNRFPFPSVIAVHLHGFCAESCHRQCHCQYQSRSQPPHTSFFHK